MTYQQFRQRMVDDPELWGRVYDFHLSRGTLSGVPFGQETVTFGNLLANPATGHSLVNEYLVAHPEDRLPSPVSGDVYLRSSSPSSLRRGIAGVVGIAALVISLSQAYDTRRSFGDRLLWAGGGVTAACVAGKYALTGSR